MHKIVILRLEAPMMSFGAPIVDNFGKIQPYPSLSQITGLLANALGYRHEDYDLISHLQNNLIYSVCCIRSGEQITDYQTVDLGQDFMVGTGWTTRNRVEERGGASSKATHIRYRSYWADSSYLVAIRLKTKDSVNVAMLSEAIQRPARPLFIGRKCCIPSVKLFASESESASSMEALINYIHKVLKLTGDFEMWTSEPEFNDEIFDTIMVTDEKDWKNQIHVGQRLVKHGLVKLEA